MLIYSMHLDFRNNENNQWQEINKLVETDGIGGIHLWSGNTGLSVTMLNALQRKSKVPILVDMDIEKGIQQRFPEGTQIPPQMAIAASNIRKMPLKREKSSHWKARCWCALEFSSGCRCK